MYVSWTIAQERFLSTGSTAAGKFVLFVIYAYSPCYNVGYNALTYTFLVELWPYAVRSRGIAAFQLFGRSANFFNTFVNPIGLANAKWKYLVSYCVWLAFEIVCVWFLWPETSGRTLEELTFCRLAPMINAPSLMLMKLCLAVFEKDELAEKQQIATEKQLFADHHDPHGPEVVDKDELATTTHVEMRNL